ncbi:hypothetical protein ANN_19056 [Periplaneta americana]|uniref:Uncharacterized protein n=1 Tax=Periplaneta americana TaxID=6978 RepID=A0ABQ8SQE8_PERAM|nr:hypothetical protein ANN_19056 [Periplaneta americana]
MAGLCEGGNEPPGYLKASGGRALKLGMRRDMMTGLAGVVELIGSLAEKKLPTEGCTGRNGEWEKSSGQKKTADDRRH